MTNIRVDQSYHFYNSKKMGENVIDLEKNTMVLFIFFHLQTENDSRTQWKL